MNEASIKILAHPRFDPKDFASRWELARLSALRSALSQGGAPQEPSLSENQLLKRVRSEDKETVLRKVFDNSRKFGLSTVRYLGMSLENSDLADILQTLAVPCFLGQWRVHNAAHVLERAGCELPAELGSLGCDYWREALDGLVVGVGEDERLARHRSRGHGDAECVDVLFVESFTPPRVVAVDSEVPARKSDKYGPISPEVALALEPARQRFKEMKVQLLLEGESEGVLYYRLDADEGVLCGAGGKLLHDSFNREFARLCPQLTARDSSPLAVYGGAT